MPTRIDYPEDYQFSDVLCGIFQSVTVEQGSNFLVVALDVEEAKRMFDSVHAGAHEDVSDHTINFSSCEI